MAHYCPGYLRRGAIIYNRKAASKHAPPGVMRRVTFAHHTFVELLWIKGSGLSLKHCTRQGWARLDSEMPPSPWECQAWSICGILKAEPEASTSLCRGGHIRWGCWLWPLAETKDPSRPETFTLGTKCLCRIPTPETSWKHDKLFWALCRLENHGLAKDHVHWTSEETIQSFHHHVP